MPTEVLYGIIGSLTLAVLALGGLWVRSHDQYRQWSMEEHVSTGKQLAAMTQSFIDIRQDISELKTVLNDHAEKELVQYVELLKEVRRER
jgi:hypothetical protein